MTNDEIPYFKPSIGDEEASAVLEVLSSGWLTTGAVAQKFEQRFAGAVGADYAVALNSCTAALHLALVAYGVGPGDEVIVPTMTFAATAEVVAYLGAELVLVDVDPDTLCLDVQSVRKALSPATRVIMPVHYGGQAADMAAITKLAAENEILIVEDAAHAFPSWFDKRPIGSIGDATCFSFYANKTITTGEGGMLVTDDEEVAARVRQLSLHGLDRTAWNRWETRSSWDYDIVEAGYKYNLTDVAASIGLVQLERAVGLAKARREVASWYEELFEGTRIKPLIVSKPEESSWHLFVIRVPDHDHRDELISALRDKNVGTSVHYRPLHLHSHYRDKFGAEALPVATDAFSRIVSLPIYPGLSRPEVERVAKICIAVCDTK